MSVRSLCPVNGWQELMVGHSREVAPSSRPTDPPALLLFRPRREVFWGKAGRERHVKSSESRARLMLRGVSIRVSGPRRGCLARPCSGRVRRTGGKVDRHPRHVDTAAFGSVLDELQQGRRFSAVGATFPVPCQVVRTWAVKTFGSSFSRGTESVGVQGPSAWARRGLARDLVASRVAAAPRSSAQNRRCSLAQPGPLSPLVLQRRSCRRTTSSPRASCCTSR